MSRTLLEAQGLSKRFDNYPALNAVDVEVRAKEVLGIIGPNGAGKTTLLEAIAGLIPIDSGAVSQHGKPITIAQRKDALFYMPDGVLPFAEQRTRHLVALFAGLHDVAQNRTAALIDRLSLRSILNQRVGELSKGTLKRLLLALSLLTPQPILLLDEPFDGLDPHQVKAAMALLRETRDQGRSLVLSIHQLADAERICDRLLLLCSGEAVGIGTLADLRQQAGLSDGGLEEIFFALT